MTTSQPRYADVDRPLRIERDAPIIIRRGISATAAFVFLLLMAGGFLAFFFLEYKPLEARAAAATGDLGEERDQRSSLQGRVKTLEGDLTKLRAESESIRAERDRLQADGETLRADSAQARAALQALSDAQAMLRSRLEAEVASGEVTVRSSGDELAVALDERVLFASGQADISPRGQEVLARVAASLGSLEGRAIRVEGHTDSTPIAAEAATPYPTNWELSTARATTVVRFLESQGIAGERLVAIGYGPHRPVADNDTSAGRRRNRRIEIILAGPR